MDSLDGSWFQEGGISSPAVVTSLISLIWVKWATNLLKPLVASRNLVQDNATQYSVGFEVLGVEGDETRLRVGLLFSSGSIQTECVPFFLQLFFTLTWDSGFI